MPATTITRRPDGNSMPALGTRKLLAQLRVASLAASPRKDCLRPRRRRRPAELRRAHPGPGARPRAAADGAACQRVDRPAADDAPQPRAHAHPPRSGRADAAFDDRRLRHRHGQSGAAPLADPAAARPPGREPAARSDRRVARRRPRPAAGLASPPRRRRADHRPDRPAPGAAARAGRLRATLQALPRVRAGVPDEGSLLLSMCAEALAPPASILALLKRPWPRNRRHCCATAA